jgi:hypothetical protein|tara:strand:+ start:3235 stop:3504 length:270 start_codon:yes stop_codon:yes gene_type:complete
VEEPLFVSMEDVVTRVANAEPEQKYVNTKNTKLLVGFVLLIFIVVIIDKNIIVGNVFQKNFVFTTKELVNVKYVNGILKNNTISDLYYI